MTSTDTICRVGFPLAITGICLGSAIGIIGLGARSTTYTKDGIADIIEEHQRESALEQEARQADEAENRRYSQPYYQRPQHNAEMYFYGGMSVF